MYIQNGIPAGTRRRALIAGGAEVVQGRHIHPGGSVCHWSFDLTGD